MLDIGLGINGKFMNKVYVDMTLILYVRYSSIHNTKLCESS